MPVDVITFKCIEWLYNLYIKADFYLFIFINLLNYLPTLEQINHLNLKYTENNIIRKVYTPFNILEESFKLKYYQIKNKTMLCYMTFRNPHKKI